MERDLGTCQGHEASEKGGFRVFFFLVSIIFPLLSFFSRIYKSGGAHSNQKPGRDVLQMVSLLPSVPGAPAAPV